VAEPDIDDDRRELSIVEPDSFTAARNARAKELRAAKEKERAAAVAKLPKPSWTAWALNVLAREHPDEIRSWLDAGDALDAALTGALAGDRDRVRDAQQGERTALGRVVERAGEVLAGAGRKVDDQARQRFTGTLRSAVTDPATRDLLVSGTLAADVEAPSFGFGFAVPDDGNVVSMAAARAARSPKGAPAKKKGAATARTHAGDAAPDDDAAEAARLAEEQQAEAARVAEEQRAEAARLEAERARLAAELAARQDELEERTREAAEADEAARRANEALDAAAAAVEAARAALDEVEAPPS
jgi:hypothetical protein